MFGTSVDKAMGWSAGVWWQVQTGIGIYRSVAARSRLFATSWVTVVALCAGRLVQSAEWVMFDVPRVVVFDGAVHGPWGTPPEGMVDYELCIPISTLVRSGVVVNELFCRIDFPARYVEIVDYLPRTTMDTNIAGKISVEQREEAGQTLGLTANGSYDKWLSGNATAGVHEKDSVALKYDVLPPLQVSTAAGTLRRRTAAYFKLKSSTRVTLEGERKFLLVVRAPQGWRVGYLVVTCRAEGVRNNVSALDDPHWTQQQSFVVAAYRRGDGQAQQHALAFSQAEQQLTAVAFRSSTRNTSNAATNPLWRLAGWLDGNNGQVPADWLWQIVWLPPGASPPKFVRFLPEQAQHAVEHFLRVKRQLLDSAFDDTCIATPDT